MFATTVICYPAGMGDSDLQQAVLRYTGWKASLFGSMMLALAGLMTWVGIDASAPAWTAAVTDGEWLVATPYWFRAPFILIIALVVGIPGLWMLWAGATKAPVVTIGREAIEARTIFGRRRRLLWADVSDVSRAPNKLVLSPAGPPSLGREIWNRRAVILDTGMLDAAPAAIEALILSHRPDLFIRDAAD